MSTGVDDERALHRRRKHGMVFPWYNPDMRPNENRAGVTRGVRENETCSAKRGNLPGWTGA